MSNSEPDSDISPRTRRFPWKLLLRLAVSAAILALFAARIDLREIAGAFAEIDVTAYAASLIVAVCGSVVISWKYFLLAKGSGVQTSLPRVVAINFMARFFGLLVPSGVGQGAVRWYKMTRNRGDKAYFLAASVFERLLFLAVAIVVVSVPLYALEQPHAIVDLGQQLAPVLIGGVVGLTVGFSFFLSPSVGSWIARLAARLPGLRRPHIHERLKRLSVHEVPQRRMWGLLLLSVLWQLVYVGRVYLLFLAVGTALPLLQVAWIASLVFLLQVLPISVGGLGVREGAYVYIFSLYGLPEDLGFLVGILFFTHMLAFAVIGGLLHIGEGMTKHET